MITTCVTWDHRARTKRGAEGPIEYRVTVNRKSVYIVTGIRCRKEEWMMGAIVNRLDAPALNERLRIVVQRIDEEINRYIRDGRPIDAAAIRRRVWQSDDMGEGFADWYDREVESMRVSEATKQSYRTMGRYLRKYGYTDWRQMTSETINELDHHLRTDGMISGRLSDGSGALLRDTTRRAYHGKLRTLLRLAVKRGHLAQDPYICSDVETSVTRRDDIHYLEEAELQQVLTANPRSVHERMAIDLFCLQAYTGMAYVDAERFNLGDYYQGEGRWIARQSRIKTGVPFVNVLLPPAVEVAERYNGRAPQLSPSTYNYQLQRIGERLGLRIRLHSHVARHTFATMMLRHGVKIENLARMLGHTDIRTTQRYARVLAMAVQEDFIMIEKKLFSDKNKTEENGNKIKD